MDPITLAATVTTFISPFLLKFGEQAAESLGEKLPEGVGAVWTAITTKFKGKPAAEEAVKDLAAQPSDADNVAAFRKELKKALEADNAFVKELETALAAAQAQPGGGHIMNTGSGAVATSGGVAAGAGGIAVGGDVQGGITLGGPPPKKG